MFYNERKLLMLTRVTGATLQYLVGNHCEGSGVHVSRVSACLPLCQAERKIHTIPFVNSKRCFSRMLPHTESFLKLHNVHLQLHALALLETSVFPIKTSPNPVLTTKSRLVADHFGQKHWTEDKQKHGVIVLQ